MDSSICAFIVQIAGENNAGAIAGYQSVNGEPDIGPALTRLHQLGHTIYLPVIHPDIAGEMEFRYWSPDSDLRINRFDIAEPVGTDRVEVADLDLVLMPLLGYSPAGHRIGMGGGYYDRIFAAQNENNATIRCGVAYSFQESQLGEPDAWDVAMHAVINEHGWFTFKR